MAFTEKSVDDVGEWLRREKLSENTVRIFRENEIDGEAFFLLTDDQVKTLVKAIGAQMKLIKKRDDLKALDRQEKFTLSASTADHCPELAPRTPSAKTDGEDFLPSLELQTPCDNDMPYGSDTEVDYTQRETSLLSSDEEECDIYQTPNKHVRVASKKKQEQPLPLPFELPRNFQSHIQEGLEEENLARAKFITTIAEAIYRFKSYPTKAEYDHVALMVVKKWDFLGRSGHGYLVEALKERMAYLRKPDGQKRGKTATPKPQAPVRHLMPSSPSVVIPPTEDKASHKRHIKYLKKECRNIRPNKQVTKDLMKRTFLFRRKDIEDGAVSMEDLFRTYPPLKSPEEIVREFNRITGKAKTIVETWGEIAPRIVELGKQEVDNHHIQTILEALPEELSEGGTNVAAMCVLYHLLPDTRFRPDHRRVITLIEEGDSLKDAVRDVPTAQPCVVVRGSIANPREAVLAVEKAAIATVPPTEIPLLLVGVFYVFNMHYTEGCKNFYSFLEVLFFNAKLPSKKTRLSALVAKLK